MGALNTHRTKPTFKQLRQLLKLEETEVQHTGTVIPLTLKLKVKPYLQTGAVEIEEATEIDLEKIVDSEEDTPLSLVV